MKKIILSAVAIFAFGIASAQDANGGMETPSSTGSFAKGDIFMTGSVGYEGTSQGDFQINKFNFMPKLGFFVTDNIAIGVQFGYEGSSNNDLSDVVFEDGAEVKTNELSIGVFGRYHFTPANQFSFFTELGFSYVSKTTEVDNPISVDMEIKSPGFEVALRPGVNYFISNNFALEASVGVIRYETSKDDFEGAESRDTFELGFNLSQINIGLLYKF